MEQVVLPRKRSSEPRPRKIGDAGKRNTTETKRWFPKTTKRHRVIKNFDQGCHVLSALFMWLYFFKKITTSVTIDGRWQVVGSNKPDAMVLAYSAVDAVEL